MQNLTEVARRLNHLNAKGGNFPPFILMTDSKRLPDPSHIIPKLPAGSAVIVRHHTRMGKINLIHKIKMICRKHKVKLLVSDDSQLAVSLHLDGVHLSEATLKKTAACGRFIKPKPRFLVTSACHSLRALKWAEACKVDAVLISPVFATDSHPDTKTIGVWGFHNMTKRTLVKTYALGGLNKKTAQRLVTTKSCGFAGISSLV